MGVQYVAQKQNPVAVFRYAVSFGSTALFSDTGFSRISGLSASVATITYREGGQQPSMRKFPGLVEFPVVRFERGATTSLDMYNWLQQVQSINPTAASSPLPDTYDSTGFRSSVYIQAFDSDMVTVLRAWTLLAAWPKSVTMGDFDAMASSAQIETMELECEAIIPTAGALGVGSGSNGVPYAGGA
jgi:phage tail-like protein